MSPNSPEGVSQQVAVQNTQAIENHHREQIARELAKIPNVQVSIDQIIPPSATNPKIDVDGLPELVVENATKDSSSNGYERRKLSSIKDWWMGLLGKPREGESKDFLREKEGFLEDKTGGSVILK